MPTTNAFGVGVRHAVTRALATHNLGPAEATFRVESARATIDGKGRVTRAEATVSIRQPRPVGEWSPRELTGLVNPDGDHPLMVRVPSSRPFFLDVVPVTWERWSRRRHDTRPPEIDGLAPRVGVDFETAAAFARELGKRLPTTAELQAAWGESRWPWGERSDPALGRDRPHRWGELPEVGLHPPSALGVWDLGAWVWQWTAEGTVFGGEPFGRARVKEPGLEPVTFRLATDG